jgi:GH18 family chitinase/alkyl hydroperoxide reductase subunit AhpC
MSFLPSISMVVPDFEASSTIGTVRLSDFNNKWKILFSYPGKFSALYANDFLELSRSSNEFKKRNVEILAINYDSLNVYNNWMNNIYSLTGIKINFPIISDNDLNLSRSYGMLEKPFKDCSVKSIFIIDDKQNLRGVLYYNSDTKSNINSIIKKIDELKQNCTESSDYENTFSGKSFNQKKPVRYKDLRIAVNAYRKRYPNSNWHMYFDEQSEKIYKIKNELINKYKTKTRPSISDLYNIMNEELECPNEKKLVAEYVMGNPQNLDPQLNDVIIYAFVEINDDGTLYVPGPTYLRQMVNLKAEKPSLKVIAAIGGWGAEGFSDASLTPSSRYNFARNVKQLITDYNLDGIDIDWEYPASSAAGIKARPQDRENFTLLLTALRDVLGDKWISVAGTGDNYYLSNSIEADKIAPLIDYFNLMSYDFTAGETGPNGRKHQANLYPSSLALTGYSVDGMINNLIDKGMPAEKILLGIPYYGRLGATTTRSYDQLRQDYINKNNYQYNFDTEALVPYLTLNGSFAMSFEDSLSLFLKTQYVLTRCLGGIFAWTSTYDQANILQHTMYQGINDPDTIRDELQGVFNLYNE